MQTKELQNIGAAVLIGFIVLSVIYALVTDPSSIFEKKDSTPEDVAQKMYDLGYRAVEVDGEVRVYDSTYYKIEP